jgi:hypothetical protein
VIEVKKRIAITLAGVLLLTSCAAQSIQPTTVHMDASQTELEHDETVSAEGVTDYYPNKSAPHETLRKGENGSLTDTTCMNANCSTALVKLRGSAALPDGSYLFLKTDDPNIVRMQDAQGDRPIGYAARNHGGAWSILPDLQQAQAYEHKGDTARTVGKVLLLVLVVGLAVAVVGAAAAANVNANTVTTRCSSFVNSTTCTTKPGRLW